MRVLDSAGNAREPATIHFCGECGFGQEDRWHEEDEPCRVCGGPLVPRIVWVRADRYNWMAAYSEPIA